MRNNMNYSETSLLTDEKWSVIDGEVCRVTDFEDNVSFGDKVNPYASVIIECRKLPNKVKGFITHKIDFLHLQKAFNDPLIKEGLDKQCTEVIIIWTKKHYKNALFNLLSFSLPKLIVWICRREAYEFINYPSHKPEIQGEARFEKQKPIVEYKPEAMK